MLISDLYREQNGQIHRTNPTWGITHEFDVAMVREILRQYPSLVSVLDYGCGKGRLGKVLGGQVQSYDPAVPEFASEPRPADLVVCTAVLEHIEPDCLDDVLADLSRLTLQMAYLKVDFMPSSHFLADGRNAHLIQQDLNWWLPKLTAHWQIKAIENRERNFIFVGRR